MKETEPNCFDCKHMACGGYKHYFCTKHDCQVSNGDSCRDFEE